jgi:hypothetical protein
MRIGWLADEHDPPGGAELTQAEFRVAAPEDVEIVPLGPDDDLDGFERYVVHNCQTYSSRPSGLRYVHDLRGGIQHGDEVICCSPAQADRLGYDDCGIIPPPINLAAFKPTRQQRRNTERKGACCVGAFMNPGKGGYRVAAWADENEPVDVYGFGPFLPEGPNINYCGPLEPTKVAQTLWQYERFVFLPVDLEPFGRCVLEAWAAGCDLVINGNVGASYWIEEQPEELKTAAESFWKVVLS